MTNSERKAKLAIIPIKIKKASELYKNDPSDKNLRYFNRLVNHAYGSKEEVLYVKEALNFELIF